MPKSDIAADSPKQQRRLFSTSLSTHRSLPGRVHTLSGSHTLQSAPCPRWPLEQSSGSATLRGCVISRDRFLRVRFEFLIFPPKGPSLTLS